MKIQGQGPLQGANLLSAYQKSGRSEVQKKIQADSLELSDRGKEIAQLQKQANALPEVREDLVSEIKQRIAAGTYDVPADKLAEKLWQEIAGK